MTPAPRPHGDTAAPVVVAVLLAAGAGSRFRDGPPTAQPHVHKLDSILPATSTEPAQSIFERALTGVTRAGVGPVVVVTGSWSPPEVIRRRIDEMPAARAGEHGDVGGSPVRLLANPGWESGQISSVRAGIAAAEHLGADRVVIGLADQPFVSSDAWRTVAAGPGPITVATYGGRRGNPVALDRAVWTMLPTAGDEGARSLMRIRPDLVREVACSGSPHDIDTAEDLRRWQNN